jgi:hypothetical protein
MFGVRCAQPDILLEAISILVRFFFFLVSSLFSVGRITIIVLGGLFVMYSLPISFPARVDRVDLCHHWEACARCCCQVCVCCCCERFAGCDGTGADCCAVVDGGWFGRACLGRGNSIFCLCSGMASRMNSGLAVQSPANVMAATIRMEALICGRIFVVGLEADDSDGGTMMTFDTDTTVR